MSLVSTMVHSHFERSPARKRPRSRTVGQLLFDRAVRPGPGARPEGSLSRPHEVVGKCTDRRTEADRKSFYTALPTPVGQTALLVKAKSQAFTRGKTPPRSAPGRRQNVPADGNAPTRPEDATARRRPGDGRRR